MCLALEHCIYIRTLTLSLSLSFSFSLYRDEKAPTPTVHINDVVKVIREFVLERPHEATDKANKDSVLIVKVCVCVCVCVCVYMCTY